MLIVRISTAALAVCCLLVCPGFGQIFEDDFNDNAAGWVEESLTGNFGINGSSDSEFGYDYSQVGIPEAPNSAPGDADTSGVRIRTNLNGLTTDQVAVYLDNPNFAGQYTVQVDMWLNWAPDPQLIGTTLHGGIYVGNTNPGDEFANAPIQRGAGITVSTDGDCGNCDYILNKNRFEMDTFSGQYSVRDFGFGNQPGYDETDVNTDPNEGDLINLPALFPSFDIDAATNNMQNHGFQQPAGAAGMQWVTVTADVDATAVGNGPNTSDLGITTFTVTNPATGQSFELGTIDNSRPDILDDDMDGDDCDVGAGSEDICVNQEVPTDGDVPVDMEGRISLILIDFFAGGPAVDELGFALFDNLKVFAAAAGLPGDFNDDGVVNAADYTLWRDNLGDADESALMGNGDGMNGVDQADYGLWVANFGTTAGTGAGQTAIPEPAAFVLLILGTFGIAARRGRRC